MVDFRSYVKIGTNTYQEHFGLDFEQFEVGQKFQHRPGLTISQQDNCEEALDTINNAQLHYDALYASKTEWKQCLGVSTMTLQKVIGMTSKTFARKKRIPVFEDIAMTHPVFGGDTLYAESEITGKEDHDNETGKINVTTKGINQNGETVAQIKYQLILYKTGKHPIEIKEKLNRTGVEHDKFSSHQEIAPGVFREKTGIYFEDLEPNETYIHRPGKTFTTTESAIHALRSIELSPQYSNCHYTDEYLEGKLLVTEPFLLGTITALTTRTFDRVVANLGWNNIQILEEVFAGDTIYATSTILDKRESRSRPTQGIMHVESQAHNQHRNLVCRYERFFLIYKKGLGPYEKAGY